MPITEAAYQGLREKALAQIRENDWKVLDVGGFEMPFMPDGNYKTLDIQPGATYVGDICQPQVWEQVRAETWDFVVCSHTLEDVRDAYYALTQLVTIAPRGLLCMPHKHTELTCIENAAHVGYCHHRWVFTVQDNTLRMMAKWPVTARFAQNGDARDTLPWLNKALAKEGDLQILWENGLEFEIFNGDFPGKSWAGCDGLIGEYRTQLAGGL